MGNERILVVDDDRNIRNGCAECLKADGYQVETAENGEEALKKIQKSFYNVVLTDLVMDEIGGIELLKHIKEHFAKCEVILMTAFGSVETAVKAMKMGAFSYITKPINLHKMEITIKNCLQKQNLESEVVKLKEMVNLYEMCKAVSSLMGLNKLLDSILKLAADTLKAEGGSIMLFDEKIGQLVVKSVTGVVPKRIIGKKTKLGERIAGYVAKEIQPILITGKLEDDTRFKHLEQFAEVSSGISAPLLTKGKLLGVVNLCRQGIVNKFTQRDLTMLSVFVAPTAIAVENVNLYEDLDELFISIVKTLAAAIDAKDSYTSGHSERVTMFSIIIAKELGLNETSKRNIQLAGLLHDIGKIGVSKEILTKKERLTREDWIEIHQHPIMGATILIPIKQLKTVIPGIRHHHERYDGNGYPDKLQGPEIPLFARIIAVADTFDALTSERPYRGKLSEEMAVKEIERCSGSQFDPDIVKAFLSGYKKNNSCEIKF
ncbi:response regulator [bacterium]|nr:response regulator [bacterium]